MNLRHLAAVAACLAATAALGHAPNEPLHQAFALGGLQA